MDRNYEIYPIFGYGKISEFDTDTLFMNIYHFWYYFHCFSSCYSWREKALVNLRKNIIKKWPSNDFSNVYLFLELVCQRTREKLILLTISMILKIIFNF